MSYYEFPSDIQIKGVETGSRRKGIASSPLPQEETRVVGDKIPNPARRCTEGEPRVPTSGSLDLLVLTVTTSCGSCWQVIPRKE